MHLRQLLVKYTVNLGKLIHQVFLIMQTSGCITYKYIRLLTLEGINSIIHNCCRICAFLLADYIAACTLSPYLKLFSCCCSEGICRCHDDLASLRLIIHGKLAYRGGFADSVYADNQYDRSLCCLIKRIIAFSGMAHGIRECCYQCIFNILSVLKAFLMYSLPHG